MKQFFKFMFASMLGYILVSVIGSIIFMVIIFSAISLSSTETVVVKNNSVLTLKLDMPIPDRTPSNPFSSFDFNSMENHKILGLNDILKNIRNASEDERIKGIYLDLGEVQAGLGTLEEIRSALLEFKKSGKFILCYSENITQTAYYLATVADKIYINPEGSIDFRGLAAQLIFFKGTMEKLEVEPQIIRHGKFKSAIEPFVLDKMSDANREQVEKYIGSLWAHMLKGISEQRKLDISSLNQIADSLKLRTPQHAVTLGMIDSTLYKDEFFDKMRTLLGLESGNDISFISLAKYNSAGKSKNIYKPGREKIAVIYASGSIESGQGNEGTIGSDKISASIRDARTDSSVKAVVLRVNSPGGSALASEVILREVLLTKAVKPVVVSMGDLAASGGYYISCGASKIIASPTTITGSIGVFGIIPNLEKFFKNKLGITFDVAKTNPNADFMNTTRPMRPFENAVITAEIERIYSVFINHVAKGRNMSPEKVDSIGQGRVWTGADAKELGLVDDFGGLDKAIETAAQLAGITDYKVVAYPKQKDPFTQIIEQLSGEGQDIMLRKVLGENYMYYSYLSSIEKLQGIQARLPYEVVIY